MNNQIDMKCFVENCFIQTIITLKNGEVERHGRFLWAIVIDDRRGRFRPGFFVHSSCIERIENGVIYTQTGSEYVTSGDVQEIECEPWQYAMMSDGTHPKFVPTTIEDQLKVELIKQHGLDVAIEKRLSELKF